MFKKISLILLLVFLLIPFKSSALTNEQRKEIERRPFYDPTDCVGGSSSTATGGDVDRFLQVIAFNESSGSGDYIAEAPGSSASGRYQYIDDTWNSVKQAYPPAIPYARASQAPGPIQDAVAKIEYEKKFKDLGNDIFKLALSHFYPAAIDDPSLLDVIVGSNTITPRQYAQSVIDDIAAGAGQDIVLRYNEAQDFDRYLQAAGVTNTSGSPTNPSPSTDSGIGEGKCDSPITNKNSSVVSVARSELESWNNGEQDISKYTGGGNPPWCAYFVSYVFREAGNPLNEGGGDGTIASAQAILDYARTNNFYHPKGEAGFEPQPGDVAIYKEGLMPYPSHVNIVTEYDGAGNFTTIGGNESNQVKQSTQSVNARYLTGFMRVE